MPYQRLTQIEFNHCDPAGIVFYPRYFEMVNSVVENFFADVVGRSFAQMHLGEGNGVPTVKIEAEFVAPSRLGEKVLFTLEIVKIGGASAELSIRARLGAEERMRVRLTLVWIQAGRAAPWPQDMRARMVTFMEEAA